MAKRRKWKGLYGYAKGAKKAVKEEREYVNKRVRPGASKGYIKARHLGIGVSNVIKDRKKGKR